MVLLRVLLEGLMLRYFFTIIIALWAMSVSANVVITGTRVIYPSNQNSECATYECWHKTFFSSSLD